MVENRLKVLTAKTSILPRAESIWVVAAAGEGARGQSLHRSFTLGSLSMASYAFA